MARLSRASSFARTLCLALAVGGSSWAAGPLGANGDPIRTSSYSIDLFQGPVFAGTRVIGLAGAYVAVSEDVDGNLQNPAAPGVRPFYSTDYFDYWLGLGFAFPAKVRGMDYYNSGAATALNNTDDNFLFATPAMNLQWGTFGIGVTAEIQNYDLTGSGGDLAMGATDQAGLATTVTTLHVQAANAFFDGQLVIGLGSRVLTLELAAQERGAESALFTTTGVGSELGLLWRPNRAPFRLGVSARNAIDTRAIYSDSLPPNAEGDIVTMGDNRPFFLPERVSLPWDVNIGAALQLGPRPFNDRWRSAESRAERAQLHYRLRALNRQDERQRRIAEATTEEERERIEREFDERQENDDRMLEAAVANERRIASYELTQRPKFYVMLASSLLISGPVEEAVGVESFLAQSVNRSGARTVYSPRLGAESEIWPELLRVRLGGYLEPSRFETSNPRAHGTFGADVKLAQWDLFGIAPDDYVWRIGGAADLSERYALWSLSIGGWYPRDAEAPVTGGGLRSEPDPENTKQTTPPLRERP